MTTISEILDTQVHRLDMDHLSPKECDWLHYINTLATWAYCAKYLREKKERS